MTAIRINEPYNPARAHYRIVEPEVLSASSNCLTGNLDHATITSYKFKLQCNDSTATAIYLMIPLVVYFEIVHVPYMAQFCFDCAGTYLNINLLFAFGPYRGAK